MPNHISGDFLYLDGVSSKNKHNNRFLHCLNDTNRSLTFVDKALHREVNGGFEESTHCFMPMKQNQYRFDYDYVSDQVLVVRC